jgi:F-type H+-transporting ATPase subunit b
LKNPARILRVLLLCALLASPAVYTRGEQAPDNSPRAAASKGAGSEHMDEPETNSDIEQYRHSSVVQAIAHMTGLKTETAAQIFEDFNSGVLLFAIGFMLWKFLPKIFRKRSADLEKDLAAARLATEDANRRLAEVEARLLRLDSEIEKFRLQVEQEAVEDEKRIHTSLEAERQRIVASAEQEIAAAQSSAQRELKKFAADLAIDNAMRGIQLSSDTDRALIREFGKSLNRNSGGKA